MSDQFPWMQGVCYEPPPLPAYYGRSRSWVRLILITAALLAVAIGGLLGLAQW